MGKPLLSVVVPTKDRYKYLKYLIELVADFHSDEIELVIQDNSDNNTEFVEYLNDLHYDFIRYSHIKGQLPMSVNSDKAIQSSSGEYVCFLGDDDGLTKYAIDCAKWMKENGIDAIKSSDISYYWSDYSKNNFFKPSASIMFNPINGKIHYLNPNKELLKVLKRGILDRGDMPLVYHNIVSRQALDEVYKKCGTYFPGNSPDISNAVALSLTVKKYVKINLPFAFSGCSVFHSGGVYADGRKREPNITEVPWFRPNVEENWDKRVPRVAAPALIWVESALSAIKSMGRSDLDKKVNFNMIYAAFAVRNPEYRDMVLPFFPNKQLFYLSYIRAFLYTRAIGIIRRIMILLGVTKTVRNVDNIKEAATELEKIFESKNRLL